jgi:hypothetical protein
MTTGSLTPSGGCAASPPLVAWAPMALIDWLTYRVELLRQREAHTATLAQQTATVAQAAQYQTVPPPN